MYERVDMVQRVKGLLEDRFLFVHQDEPDLDGVILVSGCARDCAAENIDLRGIPCRSVTQEDDVDRLMAWLSSF